MQKAMLTLGTVVALDFMADMVKDTGDMPAMVGMDSDTETMVDTDLDSAERDLPMPNLNLMPKLNLMPMLILMLGTVKDLESMARLAKDMVDTEAMVFNKQHTDSEVIPIMVDTDVLMEAILDTEAIQLVMEVTDDSGEEFIFSK